MLHVGDKEFDTDHLQMIFYFLLPLWLNKIETKGNHNLFCWFLSIM